AGLGPGAPLHALRSLLRLGARADVREPAVQRGRVTGRLPREPAQRRRVAAPAAEHRGPAGRRPPRLGLLLAAAVLRVQPGGVLPGAPERRPGEPHVGRVPLRRRRRPAAAALLGGAAGPADRAPPL